MTEQMKPEQTGREVESLAAKGFVRLRDLDLSAPHERYCECSEPDVWVRAESEGNAYRCGHCGRRVTGMEGTR